MSSALNVRLDSGIGSSSELVLDDLVRKGEVLCLR